MDEKGTHITNGNKNTGKGKKKGRKAKEQNNNPLDIVREVLKKAKLSPSSIKGEPGLVVTLETNGPPMTGIAYVFEDEARFLFYLEFPEKVPTKRIPDVAEFVTRANFGMTIGNFELDYS